MDEQQESNTLDYRKIVMGIIVLGIVAAVVYSQKDLIQHYNAMNTKEVAGVTIKQQEQSTQTKVAAPSIDLQKKIIDIADQVSNLDVKEVTASSPQVQKVLKDMEALKNLPKNEAKNACMSKWKKKQKNESNGCWKKLP